jgi:hypothetical protein
MNVSYWPPMNRILTAIADYKWGTGSTVIATFLVFIGAILLFQWKTQGRVDPLAMVNRSDPTLKSFLDGNPRWNTWITIPGPACTRFAIATRARQR